MKDGYLLIIGLFGILIIVILFYLFAKKPATNYNNDLQQRGQQINIEDEQPQQQQQRGGIGRMNIRNRRQPQQNNINSDDDNSIGSGSGSGSDFENDDDNEQLQQQQAIPLPTSRTTFGKKIGTKKLEKLKLKDEKRKYREYQEHLREEKKKNDLEKEEKLKEKRQEEKENERLIKEEEDRIRKEKERKEDEEYNLLKSQMSLEESGETKQNEDDERSLLQLFINYLKQHKICYLEDVAMEFNIKTNDVIDRIKTLDKEGLISGVIDDRGKFIYITREEMEAVAKFVNKKGRVNIEQIALESNRLIDLNSKVVDDNDDNNNNSNNTTTTQS